MWFPPDLQTKLDLSPADASRRLLRARHERTGLGIHSVSHGARFVRMSRSFLPGSRPHSQLEVRGRQARYSSLRILLCQLQMTLMSHFCPQPQPQDPAPSRGLAPKTACSERKNPKPVSGRGQKCSMKPTSGQADCRFRPDEHAARAGRGVFPWVSRLAARAVPEHAGGPSQARLRRGALPSPSARRDPTPPARSCPTTRALRARSQRPPRSRRHAWVRARPEPGAR